jgi:hypothetical protein
MSRELADRLNNSNSVSRSLAAEFPDETIALCTAATILEASDDQPIGWSWKRIFQRRGSVVITDRRIVVQSSWRSPATVLLLCVFPYGVYRAFSGQPTAAVVAVLAAILLLQRRPFRRDIPNAELRSVRFGVVQGMTAAGDILVLGTDKGALHLGIAQRLTDDLRRDLEGRVSTRSVSPATS